MVFTLSVSAEQPHRRDPLSCSTVFSDGAVALPMREDRPAWVPWARGLVTTALPLLVFPAPPPPCWATLTGAQSES